MHRKANKSSSKGFDKLLDVHTQALEVNSQSIVEILEILSKKSLSVKDKSSLKKLSKDLKGIDKTLNSVGRETFTAKEEDWFEF